MERTWKLTGAYAEWTMTVGIAPGEDTYYPADEECVSRAISYLDGIGDHFHALVNLAELRMPGDEAERLGVA